MPLPSGLYITLGQPEMKRGQLALAPLPVTSTEPPPLAGRRGLVLLHLLLVGLDLVLVGRNGRLVASFLVGLLLGLVLLDLVLVGLDLVLRRGARAGARLRERRAAKGHERSECNSFQFHYGSPIGF